MRGSPDVGLHREEQPADRREEPTEDEGDHLGAGDVEPALVGGPLVAADGEQPVAEPGAGDRPPPERRAPPPGRRRRSGTARRAAAGSRRNRGHLTARLREDVQRHPGEDRPRRQRHDDRREPQVADEHPVDEPGAEPDEQAGRHSPRHPGRSGAHRVGDHHVGHRHDAGHRQVEAAADDHDRLADGHEHQRQALGHEDGGPVERHRARVEGEVGADRGDEQAVDGDRRRVDRRPDAPRRGPDGNATSPVHCLVRASERQRVSGQHAAWPGNAMRRASLRTARRRRPPSPLPRSGRRRRTRRRSDRRPSPAPGRTGRAARAARSTRAGRPRRGRPRPG